MDENRRDPSERSLSALTKTAAQSARETSSRPPPSVRLVTTATLEYWAFDPSFRRSTSEHPFSRGSFATTP